MSKMLPSRALEGLAGLVESYGQDADMLARHVGLKSEELYRPDLEVDITRVNDLFEEAAQVCNDRFLSLKLAQIQGWDVLGPIWLLIRSAQTIGDTLQTIANHLELHSQALSAYVQAQPTGLSFSYEVKDINGWTGALHSSRVQVIELGMAITCYELRRLLGGSWRPLHVQFRHAAPASCAPLNKVFGETIYFNQDINAIHLRHSDISQRINLNNNSDRLRSLVQRQLDSSIGTGMPFTVRVDRIIRLLINSEQCTAQHTAEALGINLRTLQHRLKQNNSSYQLLYNHARLDLASHYLKHSDLSITAIGERLGFTDTASFSRFFKMHKKLSPRQFAKASNGD